MPGGREFHEEFDGVTSLGILDPGSVTVMCCALPKCGEHLIQDNLFPYSPPVCRNYSILWPRFSGLEFFLLILSFDAGIGLVVWKDLVGCVKFQ